MTLRSMILLAAFLIATVCALVVGRVLKAHGAPLVIPPACHGIGSLELAPPDRARAIVAAWNGAGELERARDDVHYDYGFIVAYALALGLGALVGSATLGPRLGKLGKPLAWLVVVAALCDVVENLGMTYELSLPPSYTIAWLVLTVSAVKWLIALTAMLYALIVLFTLPVYWRRL